MKRKITRFISAVTVLSLIFTILLSAGGYAISDEKSIAKAKGFLVSDGKGAYPDKAIKYLTGPASDGNAEAQYYLGYICSMFTQFSDNITALAYFESAASLGFVKAHAFLTLMYTRGELIPSDSEKVKEHAKAAIDGGLLEMSDEELAPDGQFIVGYMYSKGYGVEKDLDKARQWYQKAADNGCGPAMNALGEMYLDVNDEGLQVDVEKALDCFGKAGTANDSNGLTNMGLMYYYAADGVNLDYSTAYKCFDAAAKNGNSQAMYYLGLMTLSGHGVEADTKAALEWFMKSAKGGCSDAIYTIGTLYEDGVAMEQSYETALTWYTLGADVDHPKSIYKIGMMYLKGLGLPKDFKKAAEYFERAAALGSPDAMYALGNLYEQGKGVEQDAAKAEQWHAKAIEKGYKEK